ncbi:MAG: histidine kinase [Bacteroidota bacterium]|nr:histidine kinase [Bacteroidota bacterium]
MNNLTLYDLLDQRKLLSHSIFLVFSLIVMGITIIAGKSAGTFSNLNVFIMVFAQLEMFVFLGNMLFAKLNFDRTPVELTKIILVRFLVFLAGCFLLSMLFYLFLQYINLVIRGEKTSLVLFNFIHTGFNDWYKSVIKGLTFGAILFVFLLWQASLRREQKLKEENLIFQNETLKSQINPHFLFNSLNTISSLIQNQPDAAEVFINNLASVYRYILENGQKDIVPLSAELDFITDYFNLHRVRDEEKILLYLDVPDADRYRILPVSLQILLENAIKHNIATRENQLKISVYLEDQLIVVENNLQRKASQLKATGTGLKNLAERVRLVTKRNLIIQETNDNFIVKLPLIK